MIAQNNTSVWIVEDNELFQHALVRLINDQRDMHCNGVFSSCEEVLKAIKYSPLPDVILHDIGFAGMSGILSVEVIKREHPNIQIIMVTVYDDGEHIFEALRVGATGYLLKISSEDTIATSIRDVLAGGSPMNPSIARKVIEYFSTTKKPAHGYGLSVREKEILGYIIQGHSNVIIAEKLHISFHTVGVHLRNIYEKLHVHGRTEATAKILKENLL